jgi:hypothetical protein
MVMFWSTRLRTFSRVFVCLAALAMSGCGGTGDSPTGPTATEPLASGPAPDPAPAPEPGTPGVLTVTITPNPVPWSGEPAPNCNLANRWRYEQTLRNTGGTRVTISDRADAFDGVEVSKRSGLDIVLEPGADAAVTTEWCSSNNIEHRARTSFSGSDDSGNRVTFAGTTVRLLPR